MLGIRKVSLLILTETKHDVMEMPHTELLLVISYVLMIKNSD